MNAKPKVSSTQSETTRAPDEKLPTAPAALTGAVGPACPCGACKSQLASESTTTSANASASLDRRSSHSTTSTAPGNTATVEPAKTSASSAKDQPGCGPGPAVGHVKSVPQIALELI